MFDEPTRAAIQTNLLEFGNALAGRGVRPQRRDRRAAAAGRAAGAGDARTSPRPSTGLAGFVAGALGDRRRGRAGRRGRRASCSSTSRPPSAPSPTWPGRSSRRRSPRRPETEDTAIDDPAADPALPRQHRGPLQRAAAGLRGAPAAGLQRRSRRRSSLGIKALLLAPAFNAQLDPTAAVPARPQQRPGRPQGHRDLDRLQQRALDPPLAFIDTRPVGLQLRHARCSGTSPACVSLRRRARRPTSASIVLGASRRAPNSEVGPSSAPANGGGDNPSQLPPLQPLPEHRLARAGARVRGRQRGLHRRAGGDRERARQPGDPDRGQIQAQTRRPRRRRGRGSDAEAPQPKASDYDERIYRKGHPPHRMRNALILIALLIAGTYLALHQGAARSQLRVRAARRSSTTPPTSARTRRCGSPASTSAR